MPLKYTALLVYLRGMASYLSKGLLLEETADGFVIRQEKPGYTITSTLQVCEEIRADYAFMKTVLFSKYEKGPLEIYDLDSSDEVTFFLNDLQETGENLAAYLVQHRVVAFLGLRWDVLSYSILLSWGVSRQASDGLLLACLKKDPLEIEEAVALLITEFQRLLSPKETLA